MFHTNETMFHINEKLQIKISEDTHSPVFFFAQYPKRYQDNFTGDHFIL